MSRRLIGVRGIARRVGGVQPAVAARVDHEVRRIRRRRRQVARVPIVSQRPGAVVIRVRRVVLTAAIIVVTQSPAAFRRVARECNALTDPRTVLGEGCRGLVVRHVEIETLCARQTCLHEAARNRSDRLPMTVARVDIHACLRQRFNCSNGVAELRIAIRRELARRVVPTVAGQVGDGVRLEDHDRVAVADGACNRINPGCVVGGCLRAASRVPAAIAAGNVVGDENGYRSLEFGFQQRLLDQLRHILRRPAAQPDGLRRRLQPYQKLGAEELTVPEELPGLLHSGLVGRADEEASMPIECSCLAVARCGRRE